MLVPEKGEEKGTERTFEESVTKLPKFDERYESAYPISSWISSRINPKRSTLRCSNKPVENKHKGESWK